MNSGTVSTPDLNTATAFSADLHANIRQHLNKVVTVTVNNPEATPTTYTGVLTIAQSNDVQSEGLGPYTNVTLAFQNKVTPVDFTVYHDDENRTTVTFTA